MSRRKPPTPPKRLVWRMSDAAPLGELVDPLELGKKPDLKPQQPEVFSGGWVVSSFELLHGTEINEGPDTVPDDLFDALFPPKEHKPEPTEDK